MSALLLICLLVSGQPITPPSDISAKLVPLKTVSPLADFDDLDVIGRALGNAQVAAMGEATHGTREFFQMKHRVFRYLAERHNFKVFALEASMPDCLAMDRFVTKGEGDPKKALAQQGFWTWNTQEVLDLLLWMREFNKNKSENDQLRVFGFDMQSKSSAMDYFSQLDKPEKNDWWIQMDETRFTPAIKKEVQAKAESLIAALNPPDQPMAEMILQCLNQAEENEWIQEFNMVRAQVLPMLNEFYAGAETLLNKLPDLSPETREWLTYVVDHRDKPFDMKNRQSFAARAKKGKAALLADSERYRDMREHWQEQLSFLRFLLMAVESPQAPRFFDHREKCMAQNIVDGMTRIFPNKKVFVWAHNTHVSTLQTHADHQMMGRYCRELLGRKFFTVGFAFNQGSFRAAGDKGIQNFTLPPADSDFLESHLALKGTAIAWLPAENLKTKYRTRIIGAIYRPERPELYVQELIPAECYDAMILIDKTSAARGF